jgi:hypothetical protein
MQDVSAEIIDENRQPERAVRKSSNGNIALQRCYGQIGISAVAAAVRYQGDSKNPAYAPAAVE